MTMISWIHSLACLSLAVFALTGCNRQRPAQVPGATAGGDKPVEVSAQASNSTSQLDSTPLAAPEPPRSVGSGTGNSQSFPHRLSPQTPIKSIRVTLDTGDGGVLNEAVDLHLGFGFPLRLQGKAGLPLSNSPAAIPQRVSDAASSEIQPNTSVWFEFEAEPTENGLDQLGNTRQLLRGLTVSDIAQVGFASVGKSDWTLRGYKVEINGQPLAESQGLELKSQTVLADHQVNLQRLLSQHVVSIREQEDRDALTQLGFGTETTSRVGPPKEDTGSPDASPQRRSSDQASEINRLAGILAGSYPWFSLPSEQTSSSTDLSLSKVDVFLRSANGQHSGSRNPIYFEADAKKFVLSGSLDPLLASEQWQSFELNESDLQNNPLWREDLKNIGIGMLGGLIPTNGPPDRAAIRDVVVVADGHNVYDSRDVANDRLRLKSVWLVPPSHLDAGGGILRNVATDRERFVWRRGEPFQQAASTPVLPETIPPTGTRPRTLPSRPSLQIPPNLSAQNSAETAPRTIGVAVASNPTPSRRRTSRWGGLSPAARQQAENLPVTPTLGSGGSHLGRGGTRRGNPAAETARQPLDPRPPAATRPTGGLAATNTPATTIPTAQLPAPPPVIREPPAGLPDIRQVQIDTSRNVIHDGAELAVQWSVAGDASKIVRFRVEVFAVAPHQDPPTIYAAPLAVTDLAATVPPQTVGGNLHQASLQLDLSTWQAAIKRKGVDLTDVELLTLFAQPRVTAISSSGQPIATGVDGPVMPIFPGQQSYPKQKAVGALVPYVDGKASASNNAPGSWGLLDPQGSQHAIQFGGQVSQLPGDFANIEGEWEKWNRGVSPFQLSAPRVINAAVRSMDLQQAQAMGRPTELWFMGALDLRGDARVLSHVGFVNGPPNPADSKVTMGYELQVRTMAPEQTLRIGTHKGQPMQLSKLVSGLQKPSPLTLVDVPIKLNVPASKYGLDASKYSVYCDQKEGLRPAEQAVAILLFYIFPEDKTPSSNAADTEALGFFGTRVVPFAGSDASPILKRKSEGVFTVFAHGTGGHRNGRDGELITEFSAAYWGRPANSDEPNEIYQREYQKSFLILDGVGTSDMLDLEGNSIGLATSSVPQHPMPGDFDPLTLDKRLKPEGAATESLSKYRVSNMIPSPTNKIDLGGGAAVKVDPLVAEHIKGAIPRLKDALPDAGGQGDAAGNAIFDRAASQLPQQILNKLPHRGTLLGDGWDDNVAHALFVLKKRQEAGDFPKVINMTGWSRGAVTCIKLANAIDAYFVQGKPFQIAEDYAQGTAAQRRILLEPPAELITSNDLEINLFLFDPVPGRFGSGTNWGSDMENEKFPPAEMDYQQLSPIVKDCIITLANDEQRRAFAPLDADDIKILDPSRTNVVWLPFPGIHRTQLRLQPRDPPDVPFLQNELRAVPEIAWDLAWRFFQAKGTVMEDDILQKPPFAGEAFGAQSIVERFANCWLRKETYHIARNGGAQQWVQGKFGPRHYAGYPENWGSDNQAFENFFKALKTLSGKDPAKLEVEDLTFITKAAREAHKREDLFTSELGTYVQSPGFFINEYHRACFEIAYPNLYTFLMSGEPGVPAPAEAVLDLDKISGGSDLWEQLQSVGIVKRGREYSLVPGSKNGAELGQPLRDGKSAAEPRFGGRLKDMQLLPAAESAEPSIVQRAPTSSHASESRIHLVATPIPQAGSTNPQTPATNAHSKFQMIFASDTQYPWTAITDRGLGYETEDEKKKQSEKLNRDHVESMNAAETYDGDGDGTPDFPDIKGVIINGDLTEYGHAWQLRKFNEIYKDLNYPMYLGLGNHDYANNVDDTFENTACSGMARYVLLQTSLQFGAPTLQKFLELGNGIADQSSSLVGFDVSSTDGYEFPELITEYRGSLAYSWDVTKGGGTVHFVQLHNYPIFEIKWSGFDAARARRYTFDIKSSLNWLAHDLAKARNAGKIIVLNFHDSDQHWAKNWTDPQARRLAKDFGAILQKYKVSAVFVGHYHTRAGRKDPYDLDRAGIRPPPNNQTAILARSEMYKDVPVFYCGSASQSKYLIVDFDTSNRKANVRVAESPDGGFHVSKTFAEFDLHDETPTPPLILPSLDGFVTVKNTGGFVVNFTLAYELNGKQISVESDNLACGNHRKLEIPSEARNPTLSCDVIGDSRDPRFKKDLRAYRDGKTIEVWGTLFEVFWTDEGNNEL